jgi:hypothetical protein
LPEKSKLINSGNFTAKNKNSSKSLKLKNGIDFNKVADFNHNIIKSNSNGTLNNFIYLNKKIILKFKNLKTRFFTQIKE